MKAHWRFGDPNLFISMVLVLGMLFFAAYSSEIFANSEIERVSVDGFGDDASSHSYFPGISQDGRFVVFESEADNLVNPYYGTYGVFVRDRTSGVTSLVSVNSYGAEGVGDSWAAAISSDGRYVVFQSEAENLVTGDGNGEVDVFLRDRTLAITNLISVDGAGDPGNGFSGWPDMSDDGRYVVFSSLADTLVASDGNGVEDVFLRDRQAVVTSRLSISAAGLEADGASYDPGISNDGRYVLFVSTATNLVANDTNNVEDVFLLDRDVGAVERVSVNDLGEEGDGPSHSIGRTAMSADGRYVVFSSLASNLVTGDANGVEDVYLRDRWMATTALVSVDSAGVQASGASFEPKISNDGRYVVFASDAMNLVANDSNGATDIFLHDTLTGQTSLVSQDAAGSQGNAKSESPDISGDGSTVVFGSYATNLVGDDGNGMSDIFAYIPDYAFPNLVIDDFAASETTVEVGAIIDLSAVVANRGSYDASASILRFVRTSDDDEVCALTVPPLAVNALIEHNCQDVASLAGDVGYKACVDDVPGEATGTDNCSSEITITVVDVPKPNLVINHFQVSATQVLAGDPLLLEGSVKNVGDLAGEATSLRFFQSLDSDVPIGDMAVCVLSVEALAPGESSLLQSCQVDTSVMVGRQYFALCVDALVDESDPNDNCSDPVLVEIQERPKPELSVSAFRLPSTVVEAGAVLAMDVQGKNSGEVASDATVLRVYRSVDAGISQADTEVCAFPIAALAAGAVTEEYRCDYSVDVLPGIHYFGACIDVVAEEKNPENNCSNATLVTVITPRQPDLVVGAFAIMPDAVQIEAALQLTATVTNSGTAESFVTSLRFYRSQDAVLDDADMEVCLEPVAALAIGERAELMCDQTAPDTAGVYYFFACIDAVTNERNGDNNCSAGQTVTVSAKPFPTAQRTAAGASHTLLIKANSELWAWGANDNGQLGDGFFATQASPVKIMTEVQAVAANANHSFALKQDQSLWGWGANESGQLGDGATSERSLPTFIMDDVVAVAAGASHTLALKSDGVLWSWGNNAFGQLGDGTATSRATPEPVMTGIQAIAAGKAHSLAVTTDGRLLAWGLNASGQLGDGSHHDSLAPVEILQGVQTVVAGVYWELDGEPTASGDTSFAITDSGSLLAWGNNDYGQLGDGTTVEQVTPVAIFEGVQAVSAGGWHTAALTNDGRVWVWGDNRFGQVGDGTTLEYDEPVPILRAFKQSSDSESAGILASPVGLGTVEALAAGGAHTIVFTTEGDAWAWGLNDSGQLGTGDMVSSLVPVSPALTPGGSVPVITSSLRAVPDLGVYFRYQIAASNNPSRFEADNLPTGLSLDSATGVISGVVETALTRVVTLRASNAFGTGEAGLKLVVSEPLVLDAFINSTTLSFSKNTHIIVSGRVENTGVIDLANNVSLTIEFGEYFWNDGEILTKGNGDLSVKVDGDVTNTANGRMVSADAIRMVSTVGGNFTNEGAIESQDLFVGLENPEARFSEDGVNLDGERGVGGFATVTQGGSFQVAGRVGVHSTGDLLWNGAMEDTPKAVLLDSDAGLLQVDGSIRVANGEAGTLAYVLRGARIHINADQKVFSSSGAAARMVLLTNDTVDSLDTLATTKSGRLELQSESICTEQSVIAEANLTAGDIIIGDRNSQNSPSFCLRGVLTTTGGSSIQTLGYEAKGKDQYGTAVAASGGYFQFYGANLVASASANIVARVFDFNTSGRFVRVDGGADERKSGSFVGNYLLVTPGGNNPTFNYRYRGNQPQFVNILAAGDIILNIGGEDLGTPPTPQSQTLHYPPYGFSQMVFRAAGDLTLGGVYRAGEVAGAASGRFYHPGLFYSATLDRADSDGVTGSGTLRMTGPIANAFGFPALFGQGVYLMSYNVVADDPAQWYALTNQNSWINVANDAMLARVLGYGGGHSLWDAQFSGQTFTGFRDGGEAIGHVFVLP